MDSPNNIKLPHYTTNSDLMTLRAVLRDIRALSNAVNKHIVDLENELVEQAAELGNNDAIAMLAFEAISLPETLGEDYRHATNLVKQLTDLKHPLVFKLAGDLAHSKGYADQAAQYWHQYVELDPDSVVASHVYASLGSYYFNSHTPMPDLHKAKINFERSIMYGELDTTITKSHYYLGQLHSVTDPKLARYHLEVSASKGLQETYSALGFLELNVFDNPEKAIEWFKLGVEGHKDVVCLIGQFDCHVRSSKYSKAHSVLANLENLNKKLVSLHQKNYANVPEAFKQQSEVHLALLNTFFESRKLIIASLR